MTNGQDYCREGCMWLEGSDTYGSVPESFFLTWINFNPGINRYKHVYPL